MQLIDRLTFTSRINREFSGTAAQVNLGEMESTMSLYGTPDRYRFAIEWDIPDIEETHEIGLWCEHSEGGRVLYDYDGVFSLPKQAITLLMRNGITVPKDFY